MAAFFGDNWTLYCPFSTTYLVVVEMVVVNEDTAEEAVEPVVLNDYSTQKSVKLANEVMAAEATFATQVNVLRECLRHFVDAIQQGEQECLWQSQRFGTPRLIVVFPWNNNKNRTTKKMSFS